MPETAAAYFELFGLPVAFSIDSERLDQAYRALQAQAHPDRFAHAGEAERRRAMEEATRINEAYKTLKNPFERARYLLALQGIDVLDPHHTAMPPDFLLQQMQAREALADALAQRDLDAVQAIEQTARTEAKRWLAEIAECLDVRRDYAAAAEAVRKYRFLDKFMADIHAAYETLE